MLVKATEIVVMQLHCSLSRFVWLGTATAFVASFATMIGCVRNSLQLQKRHVASELQPLGFDENTGEMLFDMNQPDCKPTGVKELHPHACTTMELPPTTCHFEVDGLAVRLTWDGRRQSL